MIPADDIIEGSFRVISTRDLPSPPARRSPNRQRTVARIALWNLVAVAAAIFTPRVLG